VLEGGVLAWRRARLPLREGRRRLPIDRQVQPWALSEGHQRDPLRHRLGFTVTGGRDRGDAKVSGWCGRRPSDGK